MSAIRRTLHEGITVPVTGHDDDADDALDDAAWYDHFDDGCLDLQRTLDTLAKNGWALVRIAPSARAKQNSDA